MLKLVKLVPCVLFFFMMTSSSAGEFTKKLRDGRRPQHLLLQYGDKCTVPRQGGELSIVTECDASKGLVCDGTACVCTFSDYFAYDEHSDECRKKLGKSCRPTKDASELLELPFHLKCHSTASCTVVSRKMILDGGAAGNSKDSIDGFTMCVCKYGYRPNQKLDGCHVPSSIQLEPLLRNEFRTKVEVDEESSL